MRWSTPTCRARSLTARTERLGNPAGPEPGPEPGIAADLIAVIVAVTGQQPRVLTLDGSALPAGPFTSLHRSLQAGVRSWVEQQTHHPLGYVEQLYTFADRDRGLSGPGERHAISVSYLGLTREADAAGEAGWRGWYEYFPWEDRRDGAVDATLLRGLALWAAAVDGAARRERERRVAVTFAAGRAWNEEFVLQRYELLHEAGLVAEAGVRTQARPGVSGRAMVHDHRRILATGMARLRAKVKYRPVVFELMPAAFTLLQLQQTMEALGGLRLHKPNFRRLIEQQALVEETGEVTAGTGGRPAKLFRFRRDVLLERSVTGTKLPFAREP